MSIDDTTQIHDEPPTRPRRVREILVAGVLAFVQAGLTLVTTVLLVLGLTGNELASTELGVALDDMAGEFWAVAVIQLIGVAALVLGARNLLSGAGDRVLLIAVGVQLVLGVYWLIRLITEDGTFILAVGLTVLPAYVLLYALDGRSHGKEMDSPVEVGRRRRTRNLLDWWAGARWYYRWAVYALLIILGLTVLPSPWAAQFMSPYSDWTTVLIFPVGTYILMAIGLNIVVGMAGLLDLGYIAFFAIGSYSLAYFGTEYGWNFWYTLALGVAITAVAGVILGAPTLRLRGDYLAIVTLGFGEIVRITANNTEEIGGARGITNIPHPPSMFGTDFLFDPAPYYYLVFSAIVLVIIFAKRLEKSRVGRAWSAIREDEDAAELMGVPTFKFKLLAFAVGAIIGGLAGSIWASQANFIAPNSFPFLLSATILVAVVLGGSGNLPGVMLGAFLIAWLPERFRGLEEYRILFFGGILVLLMALRPEGLLPSRRRRAELAEGTGGMGSMGAEVAQPTVDTSKEAAK